MRVVCPVPHVTSGDGEGAAGIVPTEHPKIVKAQRTLLLPKHVFQLLAPARDLIHKPWQICSFEPIRRNQNDDNG